MTPRPENIGFSRSTYMHNDQFCVVGLQILGSVPGSCKLQTEKGKRTEIMFVPGL